MKRPKSLFRQTINNIEEWCNIIGTFLVVLVMVLICADVTYRAFFRTSLLGVTETVEMLLVPVAMLTFAYTQKKGGHVNMATVVSRLPKKLANGVEVFSLLAFLAFCAVATYASTTRAINSVKLLEPKEGLVSVPAWPSRLILAFGFLLLCIRISIQIYEKFNPGDIESTKEIRDRQADFE
jgi:TRAP-type C4-dicarboxylate transport system permease small subunit